MCYFELVCGWSPEDPCMTSTLHSSCFEENANQYYSYLFRDWIHADLDLKVFLGTTLTLTNLQLFGVFLGLEIIWNYYQEGVYSSSLLVPIFREVFFLHRVSFVRTLFWGYFHTICVYFQDALGYSENSHQGCRRTLQGVIALSLWEVKNCHQTNPWSHTPIQTPPFQKREPEYLALARFLGVE